MSQRIILFQILCVQKKVMTYKEWPRYWRAGGEKKCELQLAKYLK